MPRPAADHNRPARRDTLRSGVNQTHEPAGASESVDERRDDFVVSDPRFETPRDTPPAADELPPHEIERRRGCGCLFWGCLAAGLVILALLISIPLAAYFWLKSNVQKLTAEEPVEIAVVELPPEQAEAVAQRIEAFGEAVEAGGSPDDLVLTAEEINGLIAQNEDLRGRVLVRIEEGRLGGDVSIPIDNEVPMVGGRYLNASVDFKVSLADGRLDVRLAGGEVNGAPIPQMAIDALASENLAEGIEEEPDVAKSLERFESLEITDDRILLRAKPSPDQQRNEPEPEATGESAEAPIER